MTVKTRAAELGDCYDVAFGLARDTADAVLCHGTATGTGGEIVGVTFTHAWVEVEVVPDVWFVMDRSNGNNHFGPRDPYYRAGKVRNVSRYDRATALANIVKHSTYGPWPI